MSGFAFTKMHGAGNDFVVLDHRVAVLPAAPRAVVAALCDRRRGVGADGVLLLEPHPDLDFTMRYFNADGEAADFCGNGARCLARFALGLGLGRAGAVRFMTAVGAKSARALDDGRIALGFGEVAAGEAVAVEAGGQRFAGHFLTAGVPHFVVPVADPDAVPLADWAPPLRRHPRFGPAGANIDFVARREDARIAMRTYERGVEGETLACGSGAIATARWAALTHGGTRVIVRTRGGEDLEVEFAESDAGVLATLTGPAVTVYTGHWPG